MVGHMPAPATAGANAAAGYYPVGVMAMALLQIHNYTLLVAAGLVVVLSARNATLVAALVSLS